MAGQIYCACNYTAGLESKIGSLTENDLRLAQRLSSLERDRDRLPKLNERFGRIEQKISMIVTLPPGLPSF